MSVSLAKNTIAEVEAALEDERSTAIYEVVQIILKLAERAFSTSVEELSQLISRDPTVTEKVISCANTLGYNPAGVKVSTIPDAIRTVGFEKIRNLSITLILAENASAAFNSFDQRNAAALSVCTGLMAQELFNRPEDESQSEFLYVCASLRNYGLLLLSSLCHERFQLAMAHALNMPRDEAFKKVFGLTPTALGRTILCKTNLPRNILNTLQALGKEDLSHSPVQPEQEAQVLSDLSLSISSVLLDSNVSPNDLNKELQSVLERFSECYPIELEAVLQATLRIEEKVSTMNQVLKLSADASPLSAKLNARLNREELPGEPDYARRMPLLRTKRLSEMNKEERSVFSRANFAPVFDKVRKCLSGDSHETEPILEASAIAFKDAVELESCFFLTPDSFEAGHYSASVGQGQLFSRIKNRPYVSPRKRDIFSICLSRQEVILIQDIHAGKIGSVIPDWIHSAGKTSSFIIIPITAEGSLKSILVGTVTEGQKIDLSESDIKHLRDLRAQLGSLYARAAAQTADLTQAAKD